MKYMLIDKRNREIATICADECIRDGKQLKFRKNNKIICRWDGEDVFCIKASSVFDGEAH